MKALSSIAAAAAAFLALAAPNAMAETISGSGKPATASTCARRRRSASCCT